MRDAEQIKSTVQQRYSEIAKGSSSCCSSFQDSCCGPPPGYTQLLGYDTDGVASLPADSNLGLGCGNPLAIAHLKPGEVVLDLGCGAGFDCFLAAQQVGPSGKVIGVDMTPEMIERARANAARGKFETVEFRLGEIEHLPVEDSTIDVIISNCVVNLSPEKPRVFREAFRVLKPAGRLALSDIVACIPLPRELREDEDMVAGCVGGAATFEELTDILVAAGFNDVRILPKAESKRIVNGWVEGMNIDDLVVSATIEARKPDA